MNAISHSLAHRGPGASRTRSRWQPYHSTLNPTCSTQYRSPQSYLHTPASTILSVSPASYISPVWNLDQTRKHPSLPIAAQSVQTQTNPVRDAQKNKYVTRLVDQAVKSLCDIWRPEDIPQAFRVCPQDSAATTFACEKNPASGEIPLMQLPLRNSQLPSPISPSTQASPFCSPSISPQASSSSGCIQMDHLMPIRGFVHEVLRRSRTSTGVLQTALCYLEAVRSKVPDILQQERFKELHPDASMTEDSVQRIFLASEIGYGDTSLDLTGIYESDTDVSTISGTSTTTLVDVCPQEPLTAPPTELISNSDANPTGPPPICHTSSKIPSAPLPPLPPSPSPLLCPRRTFLACLILASKFMQDRSYSNKAWAKLAGLPPREIGRCERALGEALEWRLWVGKGPSAPSTTSGSIHRAVARCRSELAVRSPCSWPTPTTLAPLYPAHAAAVQTCSRSLSNLRRAATMPNMEANAGDGFPCANAATVSYEPSAATAMEATLIAEPDMDDFAGAPVPSMLVVPTLQASLYVGDVSSPSLSTPGLVYSPMSTSSTTSSDDGDRTAHLGFRHIPSSLGYSEISADAPGGKPFVMDYSPWAVSETIFARNNLPSLEPYVVDQPVRLPLLSEAVSNPALLERSVGHLAGFLGSFIHGQGVGTANSYSTSANWSVTGLH